MRQHRREDFKACAAMWSDPRVVEFISGKPSTEQATWMRILAYRGHWELMGFGYWALEDRETGRFVGELGFADFKRDLTPSIAGLPELGWALVPEFHGRGLATEGLAAALVWGDQNLDSHRVVSLISPQNLASLRVAQKLGFQNPISTTYLGEPTQLFERLKSG